MSNEKINQQQIINFYPKKIETNPLEFLQSERPLMGTQGPLAFLHQDNSITLPMEQEQDNQNQAEESWILCQLFQINSFNKPNGQLGHTNGVLIDTSPDEDVQIFLPAYLRMKVKNLVNVDTGLQQIIVNPVIQFSINYGKLPRILVDFLKQNLVMRFSKRNSILLKSTQQHELSIQVIQQETYQLITFIIRKHVTFDFQPCYPFDFLNLDFSIWLSPFQKINTILSISISELNIRFDELKSMYKDIYSPNYIDQVEKSFRKIKNAQKDKGKNKKLRKIVFRVNLMDFLEPQLRQERILLNQNPSQENESLFDPSYYIDNQAQFLFNKKISQLYKKLYHFQKTSQKTQFYKLKKQILKQINIYVSPNKFQYEEQHLLGQYEFVSSQIKVEYSCFRYLDLEKFRQKEQYLLQKLQKVGEKQKDLIHVNSQNSKKKSNQYIHNKILSDEQIHPTQQNFNKSFKQFAVNQQIHQSIQPNISLNTNKQFSSNHESPHKQRSQNINLERLIHNVKQQITKNRKRAKNFNYAHFQLPIYKHPFVPLAIVFFPLWIIAVINLIIYFQPRSLSNRIANIATLLISYVAYFPIFREQIPEYRYLLLAQILAYLQIVCSFFTLIQSLQQSDSQERLSLSQVGPLFWVSLSITIFTNIIVLLGYIIHKCCIQPKYKKHRHHKKRKQTRTNALRHIIWSNFECDLMFLKKRNIILLQDDSSFFKSKIQKN